MDTGYTPGNFKVYSEPFSQGEIHLSCMPMTAIPCTVLQSRMKNHSQHPSAKAPSTEQIKQLLVQRGTLVPPTHRGIWNSFMLWKAAVTVWPQPGFHGQELLLTYTAWFSTKTPQFLHFRGRNHHVPKPRHPFWMPTIDGASRTVS